MTRFHYTLAATLLFFGSLSAHATTDALRAGEVEQPEGWDADLRLPEAADLNPDPDIVEVELEAGITPMEILEGKTTPVWSYNGGLPGPLIRAKIGDRVIVHFRNSLPEATSVHWHGIRVPNEMDGVPGVTQDMIEPGGEFRYEFTVKDAGTFWYHPHANSAAQVGRGLYGPFIVEDPADPEVFGDELVMVLSDMSLDAEGRILPADSGGNFGDLFGREGEVLLVNGKVMPELKVRQGKQQRWRVINAARTRYYTLRYKRSELVRLGGDSGLAEHTERSDEIVLVPSERADFVFTPPDQPGSTGEFKWYPTDRGYGTTFNRFAKTMMTITTVDEPAVTPERIPDALREIEPIDISNAVEKDIELTIAIRSDGSVEMGINGVPHWKSKPLEVTLGETHVWTVKNPTDFDHPFHLHGYFFQVLDDSRPLEWKDTVNIKAGEELRIAAVFDERPGVWMYHCHILDHADVGMMHEIHVAAPGAAHDHVPHDHRPTHTGH